MGDTQDASVKVDFLTQVSMARRSMTDLSAKEFCKMLDPNGDKWVSDQELQVCLGKDGFLSAAELSKGLGAVAPGVITKDEVQDFVKYVDEMGNGDGRVSIFEFVRAVAPREFGISVQRWMSRDLLKRVWLGRATLQTMLAQMDKNATQSVSVKD